MTWPTDAMPGNLVLCVNDAGLKFLKEASVCGRYIHKVPRKDCVYEIEAIDRFCGMAHFFLVGWDMSMSFSSTRFQLCRPTSITLFEGFLVSQPQRGLILKEREV